VGRSLNQHIVKTVKRKLNWKCTMRIILSLLLLCGFVMFAIGCANLRSVVLHPIDQADFSRVEAGKPYTSDRDGYFLSDYYLEEVARARVDK